jgi:hypothetical protein
MGSEGLASTTRFLVLALSVLYVAAAVAGGFLVDFDSTRDLVTWSALLVVGAALMLVGQLLLPPGARSALLVSLGAAVGGLPLFWTLLVPIAVAAVIACSIALARRAAPA